MASLVIAVFFLPLKTTISNFGIILLFATNVLSIIKNGADFKKLNSLSFYLTSTWAIYLPLIIGSIYTPNKEFALDELERLLFLFLMPTTLFRRDLSRIFSLKVATYSLFIGSMICLAYLHFINLTNLYSTNSNENLFSYNFTGNNFVEPLRDMHPVFLGSYFILLLVLVSNNQVKMKNWIKITSHLAVFFSLFFLASRIIFFTYLVIFIVLFFTEFKPRMRLTAIIIAVLTCLIISTTSKSSYVYNKFVNGAFWELSYNVNNSNIDSKKKSDSRMSRWVAAYEIIIEKPLIGYGTGSEQIELMSAYSQKGMEISKEQQYNAHNQFLGYSIQLGLFGLFILLVYFISNFVPAIKKPDTLMLAYIVILFCCCLTENYLVRNMGVNFAAIFGTILHLNQKSNV